MLNYKGYTAQIEVDLDTERICGYVLDIKDVIGFHGKTVEEARQAFYQAVDEYLDFCEEVGKSPDKPFSGKLPLRTTPENHRKFFLAAKKAGKSINGWLVDTLTEAAEKTIHV